MRFDEAFYRTKIKPWPFAGPVAIQESFDDRRETIIVDKWCVVGSIKNDADEPPVGPHSAFDHDTYVILERHLKNRRLQALPLELTKSSPVV